MRGVPGPATRLNGKGVGIFDRRPDTGRRPPPPVRKNCDEKIRTANQRAEDLLSAFKYGHTTPGIVRDERKVPPPCTLLRKTMKGTTGCIPGRVPA